jgi:thioredoxin 1
LGKIFIFVNKQFENSYSLPTKDRNPMAKFGEIINVNKPVLIDFYSDWNEAENSLDTLRDVAAALGTSAKVIKIDIKKNEILADALRVKGNPTFMIYKDGEMKWRQTGHQEATTLIDLVQQYV